MTLCFLIYGYFPYGGQQRDFLRIALACQERGHRIRVYTLKWQGAIPQGFDVRLVPVSARTRHQLYPRFNRWVREALRGDPADCVIGFNRMPGLDVYFAADPCFAEKAVSERGLYYRFTPRYRHFIDHERAVFSEDASTRILLLSNLQYRQYLRHYPEAAERMEILPPGVDPGMRPPRDKEGVRVQFRNEFGIGNSEYAVLQVGSGYRVKGVGRSLRAIASLPKEIRDKTCYILVGQDKSQRYRRLASRLGIAGNCLFAGARDDVPRFLQGSDLMLHPAYSESAGYVLLEAVINGLPVLTTDSCGFASHVQAADCGQVCASPFRQSELNVCLLGMLRSPQREQWRRNGLRYGEAADLYSLAETAARRIESIAGARGDAVGGAV